MNFDLSFKNVHDDQEEVRIAKDSLQRTEEAADLMAEKSMIAEQEAMLLQQKATEAENELQVKRNHRLTLIEKKITFVKHCTKPVSYI